MLSLSAVTSDSPGITIRGHISYTNKTGRDKRILRGAAGSAGPRASQQFLCLHERSRIPARRFSQKLASCVLPQRQKGMIAERARHHNPVEDLIEEQSLLQFSAKTSESRAKHLLIPRFST
uniref:(northern house mosquito) hypothetical protein n=1 Tax=Culex pipiens TaxID=7175 RepID=A0A8D8NE01_CULPI